MKHLILHVTVLFLLFITLSHAQTDSLYLGLTPPSNIPVKFDLQVQAGCIATERIAISPDGTEIYFNAICPAGGSIHYYKYSDHSWNGPTLLFDDAGAPAISTDGNTMYFGKLINDVFITHYAASTESGWSDPIMFSIKLQDSHHLQSVNGGTFYASMLNSVGGIGGKDWSRITMNTADTLVQSLGAPVNNTSNNFDFYIARDESFIIFASDNHESMINRMDLYISFKQSDNSWTDPQNLGSLINKPGCWNWGPYVSPDGKYLFYSTYNNLDANVTYWVRIDETIESLRPGPIESGLETDQIDNKLNVFPNPASEMIKVNTGNIEQGSIVYQIFDMTGSLITQGNVVDQSIDVSILSKGLYLLKLMHNNTTIVKEVLIE